VSKFQVNNNKKENIIVFPHRLHPEKQIDLFNSLQKVFPECKFVVTHGLNLSKKDYYKLLAKSKIIFSASLQENFGYSILEGCTLDVMPVLPFNNTDYKYIYPKEFLYENFEGAIKLIRKILDGYWVDLKYIPFYYHSSLDRQAEIIKKVMSE
jgi:hypothetical protein